MSPSSAAVPPPYPTVAIRDCEIVAGRRSPEGHFVLTRSDGAETRARHLLLATGRRDDVPTVPGFAEFYGRGVS